MPDVEMTRILLEIMFAGKTLLSDLLPKFLLVLLAAVIFVNALKNSKKTILQKVNFS